VPFSGAARKHILEIYQRIYFKRIHHSCRSGGITSTNGGRVYRPVTQEDVYTGDCIAEMLLHQS